MKKKFSLAFLTVVLGLLAYVGPAFAAVSIVLPNGGECLIVGQAYTIEVSSDADHVALYYRTDGQQPTHLDGTTIKHPLQQSSWNWTPGSGDVSETGRVWVEGHLKNHNTNGEWDDSDADFAVRSSCGGGGGNGGGGGGGGEGSGGSGELPPPTVQTLETREINATSAVIYWVTGQYGYYRFSYGTSSGKYSEEISTGPPDPGRGDHTVVLADLLPDTEYYFQIITGHLRRPTESDEYSFRTKDTVPPARVRNVFRVAGSSTALLAWTNPPDADFKETVVVSRTDRFAENRADGEIVFIGEEAYYVDAGLASGTTHYYSIFTVDEKGNISAPVNISLAPQAGLREIFNPPSPEERTTTTFRVASLSSEADSGVVALSWKNPADALFLGVQIVRSTSSLPANASDGDIVFRGQAELFRDEGLSPETRYNYGIFPFDWDGNFYSPAFISEFIKPPPEEIRSLRMQIAETERLIRVLTLELKAARILRSARTLRLGKEGEEVRLLQELLASRADIYPEGLVTGYFGSLTRGAVRRLQAAYGIVSSGNEETTGYGLVGPRTRGVLLRVAVSATDLAAAAPPSPVPSPPPPVAEIYEITILPSGFDPRTITVPLGDRVKWTNRSGTFSWVASNVHPTHEIYPEFDAERALRDGESYSFIFERSGRWEYHDHVDPEKTGVVIVESASVRGE